MNGKLKIILGAMMALGFTSPVFALAGDSPENATALTPSATKQSRTVTLVQERNGGQLTGYYCYNFRLTLTRGNQYTFTVKLNNDSVYDALLYFTDYQNEYLLEDVYDDPDVSSGALYRKYIVRARNWDFVSADSVTMYAYFYGEQGGRATFTCQATLDVELGTELNPETITVSTSNTQTKNITFKDVHTSWGYHLIAELTAGTKYSFKTVGGTEANGGMYLNVQPYSYSISYPQTDPIDVDGWNEGWTVIPVDSGMYEIVVYANSAATIQYGGMPSRLPAEHDDVRPLANGVRQTCVPGKKHADNSPYYDEVIDTQLYSFTASGKGRYLVETDSGVVPLLLEAYDANGTLLAVNSASQTNDSNCRIAFEVPAAGTYYVGVCEDIEDSESYALAELPIGITLRNITDVTEGFDEFDPTDDIPLKASRLSPPLTSNYAVSPNQVDLEGHGPHRLSVNDWMDTFVIGCRAGLQYDIQFASSETNGNALAADVFTLDVNGGETPVDARFSEMDTVSFIASSNAAHYVRLYVMSPGGEIGHGLDYPDYMAHCVARSMTAAQYGYLTVDMRGPSSDSGATWRITGGTSAVEPPYPFGSTITEKGTITITPSDVEGFSAPSSKTVTIQAGVATNLLFMYNDSYDSGDDTQSGAVSLTFSATENAIDRTLWIDDPADWFSFTGVQGVYYNVRFVEKTGSPRISVIDANGNLLAQSDEAVSVAAPQAGTYYVKIDHGENDDASYRLSYSSVNVGTVGFVNGGSYTVSEDAAYIDIPVSRTSSEGAIALRYGTVAGTATAGEDYSPVSGVLKWAAGESAAKNIRIKLLPELRPVYEGNEQLYLKLESGAPENDGEYAPVLSAPDVATITITDVSSPAAAGTVSLALAGDAKAAISNATVKVAPGEAVRLWLTRRDGSNGDAQLTLAAIDDTAQLSQDYFGAQTQEVSWTSGETGDRCVMFTTSRDVKTAKRFTVRIMEVAGNGAEPPAIGTRMVSVVIDPSRAFPDYGGTALQSAAGTFTGVLRERFRFGDQSLAIARIGMTVTDSSIQATLTMAGATRTFTGTGFDSVSEGLATVTLSNDQTIDEITYTDTLTVKVRMSSLADYEAGFPAHDGEVTAMIYVPNADGITADEYLYTGVLRRDNSSIAAFASSITPIVGKYTVALVPRDLPLETEPKGLSTLSVTVAADGSVAVSGTLTDGTAISTSAKASVIGSLAQAETGGYSVAVPIYFGSATVAFGGELSILANGGTPVVHYSGTADGCFVLANSDANTTQWAAGGFSENLIPVGGWYDDSANPAALAIGKEYTADSGEWAFVDTNDLSCVSLTTNASGVVSGNLTLADGTYAVNGVVLMNKEGGVATTDDLSIGATIAVPTAMGQRTWRDSYPLYIRMNDTDPDWTEDFGLSATITFNGNGNTGGYAPASMVASVRSTEFIPEVDTNVFTRTGYEFVGWRDEAGVDYVGGDEFLVPVSNTTLTAVWTFSVAGVPEALDCAENSNLVFVAGGDAPWIPQTAVTHGSPSAIQSGEIDWGGTSWIEARVSGSGRLSFWYKVSCISFHSLVIMIDGVEERFSGNVDWTEYVKEFSSGGIHTIRWTYTKAAYGWDDGSADKAWVDQLAFGPTVTVTFDPAGGTMTGDLTVRKVVGSKFGTLPVPESATQTFDHWEDDNGVVYTAATLVPENDVRLTAKWREKEWTVAFDGGGADSGTPPASISRLPGTEIVLPGPGTLAKSGYEFNGWSDGTTIRTNGATYVVGTANVTMTAQWSLSVTGVGEALGNTSLTYSAGGDAAWYPQSEVVLPSGSDAQAVRSGAIEAGGTTWLETQVSGSGRLSFWYKVSCLSVNSFVITIDGVEERFNGNVDWTEYVKEFSSGGTHTIRWAYTKAAYGWPDASVSDAAWIDELQFGQTVTVTFDPTIGTMTGERSVRKVVGAMFGTLPRPESTTMTFDYWKDGAGNRYSSDTLVPDHDVALTAVWKDKEWEVRFAGGGADSGTPPEVQSGLPGDEITLPGPGTLRKAGYEFNGWSDGTTIYTNGATYVIGAADVMMTAQWSLSVTGIGEALGNTSLTYSAGGDAAWYPQSEVVLPSGSDAQAVRSGAIEAGGTTWLETQVSGSGRLSFWYKVSCISVNSFVITIDGVEEQFNGNVDWTEYVKEFTSGGTHTIRWAYTKASYGWPDASVSDAAWVDELTFGPTITATFDPAGGTVSEASRLFVVGAKFSALPTPTLSDSTFTGWTLDGVAVEEGKTEVPATNVTLVAQWRYADRQVAFAAGEGTGTPPAAIAGQPFTDITLPGQGNLVAPTGYSFAGWSDGTSLYRAGDTFTFGTVNVTLVAQWSYAVDGYAEALNCDAPVYTAGGYAAWRLVTDEYDSSVPGNTSSLRSGTIPYSTEGSTWCQAQVSGAGYLSFKWKVSALSMGNCHFKVLVDGVEVISQEGGITEWREYATAHLDEGVHTVRWTYSTESWVWEDTSTPKAQNCAWVDNLVWIPDAPPGYEFEIVKGAGVSDVVVSNGTALVEVTDGKFIAETDAVLTFAVAADGVAMPVYSATFEGADCSKAGYGVYTFTVGADGGAFTFSATAASAQSHDAASQAAAKEAIVASVDVAATGKTLDETKTLVSEQVEAILAAHANTFASDVAGWICANGFSGADVALAKEIDVSYGLQATTLFTDDPVAVITSMTSAEPANGAAVAYELTFQILNGEKGEAVAVSAAEGVKAYVATLVKASGDLSDWSSTIAGVVVTSVYESATTSVKVKVSLPSGLASAFMKVEK